MTASSSFHAGAGRDIDLVSILGYDPTPFDIPSLYLGLNAFREVYGPGYQGIPVRNGSYFITNSVILPETEGRTFPTVGGTAYLELGINGILTASIGNFLGLPDLFDTNTGHPESVGSDSWTAPRYSGLPRAPDGLTREESGAGAKDLRL